MSILIKSPKKGTGSGSSKGFPPGDASNISAIYLGGYVNISWNDPKDIIYNNTTISAWAGTIVVRKTGSYPTSPTDGTVVVNSTTRNAYKDTPFKDNVSNITNWYYRLYTYNSDKVYNDSTSMIFKASQASNILSNNSWSTISSVAESGIASSIWNIGDEIDITLSGECNGTMTLQIWDFNHFDKSDGSGKAGITFGTKNLTDNTSSYPSFYMWQSGVTTGGWNESDMKKTYIPKIISSMPPELQSVLKEVETFANCGGGSVSTSNGLLSTDKVFIPGFTEVFGSSVLSNQSYTELNQSQFPIFTNDSSRIKETHNTTGQPSIVSWPTRSPMYNNKTLVGMVNSSGKNDNQYSDIRVVICFCFNV